MGRVFTLYVQDPGFNSKLKKITLGPGIVKDVCNGSLDEAEAEGLPLVQGQAALNSEFHATQVLWKVLLFTVKVCYCDWFIK